MQDYTRTQKPDTGNDALDDPACIGIGIFSYGQHGDCRCEGNKPKRSHSRRFLPQLKINSDQGSSQRRGSEAKNNIEPLKHNVIPVEDLKLILDVAQSPVVRCQTLRSAEAIENRRNRRARRIAGVLRASGTAVGHSPSLATPTKRR